MVRLGIAFWTFIPLRKPDQPPPNVVNFASVYQPAMWKSSSRKQIDLSLKINFTSQLLNFFAPQLLRSSTSNPLLTTLLNHALGVASSSTSSLLNHALGVASSSTPSLLNHAFGVASFLRFSTSSLLNFFASQLLTLYSLLTTHYSPQLLNRVFFYSIGNAAIIYVVFEKNISKLCCNYTAWYQLNFTHLDEVPALLSTSTLF